MSLTRNNPISQSVRIIYFDGNFWEIPVIYKFYFYSLYYKWTHAHETFVAGLLMRFSGLDSDFMMIKIEPRQPAGSVLT